MEQLLPYVFTLIVAAALVFMLNRQRPASDVDEAYIQWQDALDQAPLVVAAIEQLWVTGAIPKDARLDEAMRQLGHWFPALTEQQLRTAIEAGVHLLKQGVDILEIELPELPAASNGKPSARKN